MNAIEILENGHQTVLSAVEGLPEEHWHTPGVVGVWSVKDVIAHLASFEVMLIDVLRSIQGCGSTETLDAYQAGLGAFNDRQVGERRGRTIQEVWKEYLVAHTRAMALMREIPEEDRREKGALPWYGAEYDLEDFLVYTFYGHKREHCAQIGVYRDRLEKEKQVVVGEMSAPAMDGMS